MEPARSSTSSSTTGSAWAPRSRLASAEPELYKRGCSYRIPGERVDGDDADRGSRRRPQGAGDRPGRAPAAHARGDELPAPRPLGGRPGPVPLQGGQRGRPQRRPGARVPRPADRARASSTQPRPTRSTTRPSSASTAAVAFADDSPDPTRRISCSTTPTPPRWRSVHRSFPATQWWRWHDERGHNDQRATRPRPVRASSPTGRRSTTRCAPN